MIDLRDGRITDILPGNLSSQVEVQAFGYALHRQIARLCDMADRTRIYAAIRTAPDEILDYMAVEMRTPCYDMAYSTEIKRSLILSTLPYYMKMGTVGMVNSIIQTIFGDGHIIEFFEAGLEPHHFAVKISGAEATSRPTSEFRAVLEQVKRKSQWLDSVILEFAPMERVLHCGGLLGSIMSTPIAELPDEVIFRREEYIGGSMGVVSSTPLPEM